MCLSGYGIVWVEGLGERNVNQGRDLGVIADAYGGKWDQKFVNL